MYFLEKYHDNQYTYSNDADVNFDVDVQKRKELLAQPNHTVCPETVNQWALLQLFIRRRQLPPAMSKQKKITQILIRPVQLC